MLHRTTVTNNWIIIGITIIITIIIIIIRVIISNSTVTSISISSRSIAISLIMTCCSVYLDNLHALGQVKGVEQVHLTTTHITSQIQRTVLELLQRLGQSQLAQRVLRSVHHQE